MLDVAPWQCPGPPPRPLRTRVALPLPLQSCAQRPARPPRWFVHQTPTPAALHFQVAGKRQCFLASSCRHFETDSVQVGHPGGHL